MKSVIVTLGFAALATLAGVGGSMQPTSAPAARARVHASAADLPWTTTNRYPDWFRKTYRYKELVGGVSSWQSVAGDWKGIPHREIRMGTLQLDRGGVYPFHAHPAPELYYVVAGRAEWTVGQETFVATPGTVVHTPPDTRHRIINTGDETLELIFIWWAPGGETRVLDAPSRMLEGWDKSPR